MKNLYDVVIIGGGPAGLTAALYLARAKYRVVVVEKEKFGGQITITHEVVNYPGVAKTSGAALTETMRQQAESFGAEFILAEVESLDMNGDVKTVKTSRGELKAFGVLLATGAHPRMVGFKGEDEYRGRGVAYCATCDGEFFTGKDVFVVGGGFAAAEEAVFLTKYARQVTILIRRDDFSCAASAADHARSNPKITVLTNTVVDEVSGDGVLRKIRYTNKLSGETTEFSADDGGNIGVFVFAGYAPETSLVKELGVLNDDGYVITDRSMKTSVDGLYAAGDVCIKALRQVVTAVGDGALAATELEKYAAQMQTKTGLKPQIPETEKSAAKETAKSVESTAASGVRAGASGSSASSEGGTSPESGVKASGSGLFDEAMMAQLNTVFGRMESNLILKLYLDERPVSAELKGYMEELASVTDKLKVEVAAKSGAESASAGVEAPCVRICREDGSWSGLAFHGVPGGHEFTSFVLGLYNAAGPGQALDPAVLDGIRAIGKDIDIKVLVSLSCTMCPELVTATQRLTVENSRITAEVFDINHFPAIRDQYNVMSVPCLVINNGEKVSFGKKNAAQVLELLK
ncbi:MAG: FAD-dependent oxidoreductase [Firmicutes bacterium]|nr:FAD-dependent oxidoreductase [Bacillota bacterium]